MIFFLDLLSIISLVQLLTNKLYKVNTFYIIKKSFIKFTLKMVIITKNNQKNLHINKCFINKQLKKFIKQNNFL